jgi:hypothetical protein
MTAPNVTVKIASDFRTAQQQGRQYLAQLEQGFSASAARIKEDLTRGIISPIQAAAREAELLRTKNAQILGDLKGLRDAGQLAASSAGGSAYYTVVANGLQKMGDASKSAGIGINALRGPLTSVVANLSGVQGPLGSLASILLQFSQGGTVAVGVVAGIGVIAGAWRLLTEETRKATKQIEDAVKHATEIINSAHPVFKIEADFREFDKAIKEVERRLDDVQHRRGAFPQTTGGFGAFAATAPTTGNAGALQQQLDTLLRGRAEAAAQVASRQLGAADAAFTKDAERLAGLISAHRATNAEIDRGRHLLADYEAQLARLAPGAGNPPSTSSVASSWRPRTASRTRLRRSARRRRNQRRTRWRRSTRRRARTSSRSATPRSSRRSTPRRSRRSRRRTSGSTPRSTPRSARRRSGRRGPASTRSTARSSSRPRGSTPRTGAVSPAVIRSLAKTAHELTRSAEFHDVVAQDVGAAVTDGVLQGLEQGIVGGRSFWQTFARLGESILGRTFSDLFARFAKTAAGQALGAGAAVGVAGYDVGFAVGTKGQAVGALAGAGAGALAGAAVGGPIGAVVGGAVGAITGLIGAHNRAKDAANKMAAAQEAATERANNENAPASG